MISLHHDSQGSGEQWGRDHLPRWFTPHIPVPRTNDSTIDLIYGKSASDIHGQWPTSNALQNIALWVGYIYIYTHTHIFCLCISCRWFVIYIDCVWTKYSYSSVSVFWMLFRERYQQIKVPRTGWFPRLVVPRSTCSWCSAKPGSLARPPGNLPGQA